MHTWAEINSRKYSAMAFSMIEAAGLDRAGFAREDSPPTFRIVYLPTRDHFFFGHDDGGANWSRPGYPGKTSQTARGNPQSWDEKIKYFERWLKSLVELLAAAEEVQRTEMDGAASGGSTPTGQPSTAEVRVDQQSDVDSNDQGQAAVNPTEEVAAKSPAGASDTEFSTVEGRTLELDAYIEYWRSNGYPNCSRAALARAALVDPADLSKWERGKLPPTSDKVRRIEQKLTDRAKPVMPERKHPEV